MPASLQDLIDRNDARLTRADRRLLGALLTDPRNAAFFSTTELAQRAGVNQATAVRLAKKLGFAGYPEMRASLRHDLLSRSEPARRIERRIAESRDPDLLTALIDSEVLALEGVRAHVAQGQLDAVAATLIPARRVLLFGQGHATSLVDLMDRRLRRSGFATRLLTHQGRELAERLLDLQPQDVVLAFAFHAVPRGLRPVLAHARATGARTVLISDAVGHEVRPRPDRLLAAPRGPEEAFQTLAVPMLICNALVLTVARLDQGRSMQSLDRLAELIRELDQET
jgi:DNA-binding MurR/RpiR family transcriptional regulator